MSHDTRGLDSLVRQAALITGASRGIGRAIAQEFAAQGHALCLVARKRDDLQRVAQELSQRYNVPVTTYAIDVTEKDAPEHILQALAHDGFSIKYLVNNAGCWSRGDIGTADIDELERVVATNILAPLLLTKALLPQLSTERGGVLWISSLAAIVPTPAFATYGASKAFVRALSIAVHRECQERNITSCVALPGFVRTDFVGAGAKAIWYRMCASDPETVARAAYRAIVAGQRTVVPGLLNRILYLGIRSLPGPITDGILQVASRRLN